MFRSPATVQVWRIHSDPGAGPAGPQISLSNHDGGHVGETGILAAAGRHFAQSCPDLRYVEGAFGKMLRQEDVIEETHQFGSEGKTADLDSPGLGVTIKMDSLLRYSKVINTK